MIAIVAKTAHIEERGSFLKNVSAARGVSREKLDRRKGEEK